LDAVGEDVAAVRPEADGLATAAAKTGVEQHQAALADKAAALSRAVLERLKHPSVTSSHWIDAALAIGLVLAIGMLFYMRSHGPDHLSSPASRAVPGNGNTSADRSALAKRTGITQGDAVPAAEKGTEGAAACTGGMAALGLCPSESRQAQPVAEAGSSTDVASPPPKDRASGGCKEAAVALGLCAE